MKDIRVSSYSRVPSTAEKHFYGALIKSLAARRQEFGMTQEDLDDTLGTSSGQVAKWESFDRLPGAFMMVCWANALDFELSVVSQARKAKRS